MLESIASVRQVDRKTLRMTVKDLKDCLHNGEIDSYLWLPVHEMWAKILTKKKKICFGLESSLLYNVLDLPDGHINLVWLVRGEIRMENIRN